MKRVVLTGSESTGKTELARQLAAHFGAPLAHEFLREFVSHRPGMPLTLEDHGPIARGAIAADDEARARAESLVVLDTDLLSTVVYCGHYYGQVPEWIAREAQARVPDLYLLLDIDVPWIPDSVRDRGERREEMHRLFLEAVERSGAPYVVVRGTWAERFEIARHAVQTLVGAGRTA